MINSYKSKVFCRVGICKEKHSTLLHAVNLGINNKSPSRNTTQNYQTNQHTAVGLHSRTSELPRQLKEQ